MGFSLQDMKQGDVKMEGYDRFLRVPGGWVHTVYTHGGDRGDVPMASCFIPLNMVAIDDMKQ